jgi:hypothetical protein
LGSRNEGGIDKSKTQELGPSAPPIDNYLSSSFTGAATIDLAVDTLTDLPDLIIKDSQYALLFSNSDIISNETITPQIPEPTKAFLLYACLNVAPFAVKLKTLQDFNRSETSVLSIDPELVSTLRRTYLRMRGWPGLSGSSDVNRSEPLSNKREDEDFGKYFGATHGSISKER